MTEADLAYAAGLFEGEGSIGIFRNSHKNGIFLRVMVSMTDPEPVAFMQAHFSGALGMERRNMPGRTPLHRWTACSRQAGAFLEAVLPYLRTERVIRRARLAVEFQAQKGSSGRKDDAYNERQVIFYERMKALGRRASRETASEKVGALATA